jgi:aryl carrier-like protein
MIPKAWFLIGEIPRNNSGKVDRKRLRHLGSLLEKHDLSEAPSDDAPKLQPANPIEKSLQILWAKLLQKNVNEIGLEDHFMRSGGDSITAMQLVAEARRFGMVFEVADILRYPTPCALAGYAASRSVEAVEEVGPFSLLHADVDVPTLLQQVSSDLQFHSDHIEDIYSCTPLQEGLASSALQRAGDYVGQFILEFDGSVDIANFRLVFESVFSKMPVIRTRFVQSGDNLDFVQVVVDEKIQWIESADLDTYLAADRGVTWAWARRWFASHSLATVRSRCLDISSGHYTILYMTGPRCLWCWMCSNKHTAASLSRFLLRTRGFYAMSETRMWLNHATIGSKL